MYRDDEHPRSVAYHNHLAALRRYEALCETDTKSPMHSTVWRNMAERLLECAMRLSGDRRTKVLDRCHDAYARARHDSQREAALVDDLTEILGLPRVN